MCRVIVADDEYLEREVLKKVIGEMDDVVIVGEVSNGRCAVNMCRDLTPDLIFLNLRMGGLDGVEAARQINKINNDIKIFITTASEDVIQEGIMNELGVEEFLLKPIKPFEIRDVVLKHKSAKSCGYMRTGVKESFIKNVKSKEIIKALEFIDENYLDNLSLETVSKKVFLSTFYFSRLFKKEVGTTFSNYLGYKKIEAAKELLVETEKSILEISVHLGFKEQNYFCKVFRKNSGYTPTEFRKISRARLENS